MKIPHHQLEAFETVARLGNFSKAAKSLHITQPALSKRIQELESLLETGLFIRSPKAVELTEAGQKLLKHAQVVKQLEKEFLFNIGKQAGQDDLGGTIKICGPASVMHPVVIPSLAPFLTEHTQVQLNCVVLYQQEIAETLLLGKTDLAISDQKIARADVVNHLIGKEQYVLTESKKAKTRKDVFLDNNPDDRITEQFFEIQKTPAPKYRRSFMSDEWGIQVGTELGIGRAVKPKHMITPNSEVKILQGYKTLVKPVYLHYRKQKFYSKLQESAIAILLEQSEKILKRSNA